MCNVRVITVLGGFVRLVPTNSASIGIAAID